MIDARPTADGPSLIGHVNALGTYPAPVIPVFESNGQRFITLETSEKGLVAEPYDGPFVAHENSGAETSDVPDPIRHRFIAITEHRILWYDPRNMQAFVTSLIHDHDLLRSNPYLVHDLASEAGDAPATLGARAEIERRSPRTFGAWSEAIDSRPRNPIVQKAVAPESKERSDRMKILSRLDRLLSSYHACGEDTLSKARQDLMDGLFEWAHEKAGRLMRGQINGHTLQATALVSELWLHFKDLDFGKILTAGELLKFTAISMKRILVDHAKKRTRVKRGGAHARVELGTIEPAVDAYAAHTDLENLDEALRQLATILPRQATIVEMTYFGRCTAAEVATALGTSPRTVERDLKAAKAWLRGHLASSGIEA